MNKQAEQYFEPAELKKYEGEWIYADSIQTFKINLKKQVRKTAQGAYLTELYGNYCYSKNENKESCFINEKDTTISNATTLFFNKKDLFFLKDRIKEKRGEGFLKLLPNSTEEVEWYLRNPEGMIGDFDQSFSVPTKLILKKVK
ncbi:DUF6705 family protein [Pedobacter arcticus]|uniref:DUF6705 family protein n=1 Tax=Pedobacter arcticus TaxID=752140 RepID=UPI000314BCA0|nr:DUF6705 family protein [Pedobacter arcticus]